jgi:hypothetical protein
MSEESCQDFSGFPPELRKEAEQCVEDVLKLHSEGEKHIRLPGQGCSHLNEPLPTFDKMECETVYPSDNGSDNNAYMVFGRDRHTRKGLVGYGGIGCTSSGMIDLVVGRGGPRPKHRDIVGPNFFTDAARIYISQRADIDSYFNLPTDKNVGVLDSVNRSAIGLKADSIRIIGREGVRIVTNRRTDSSDPEEYNSRGEPIQSDGPDRGIHLIAHGKTGTYQVDNPLVGARAGMGKITINRLQPMVKGENLKLCLDELIQQINELLTIVNSFTQSQMDFNQYVATHTHEIVGPMGGMATPSIAVVTSWAQEYIDQINNHVVAMGNKSSQLKVWYRTNYLEPSSDLSFLSRYNKTN